MKAVYLSTHASVTSLTYGDLPPPHVHDGGLLVKVHAAGIMPRELDLPSTFQTPAGDPRPFPIVLGHQFSGVVEACGAEAGTLKVGDAVYGINDWFSNGVQAEYCVAPAISMVLKPRLIDHVQASVLPIPALAAWHGLFDLCRLQCDHHVLIHGATESVGIIAVQLARWRGARITATASSGDRSLVHLLGADTVIDDRARGDDSAVKDVDVVLDCVGSDEMERSFAILIAGGRFATVANRCAGTKGLCVWESLVRSRSHKAQLTQIGNLIDAGDIRVFVDSVYPLSRAKKAYARSARGKRVGEVSVRMAE